MNLLELTQTDKDFDTLCSELTLISVVLKMAAHDYAEGAVVSATNAAAMAENSEPFGPMFDLLNEAAKYTNRAHASIGAAEIINNYVTNLEDCDDPEVNEANKMTREFSLEREKFDALLAFAHTKMYIANMAIPENPSLRSRCKGETIKEFMQRARDGT